MPNLYNLSKYVNIKAEKWHLHKSFLFQLTYHFLKASLMELVVKNLPANAAKRYRFNPRVGKIPWWKKWQPTQCSCLENRYGQRSLVGYGPWSREELDTTGAT